MCQRFPDQKRSVLSERENGATLIEVMVVAVLLLIVSLGLEMLVDRGFQDNITQSQISNNILANLNVIAATSSTGSNQLNTVSIPVSVTSSAGSAQIVTSIATSSIQGNADGVFQTP